MVNMMAVETEEGLKEVQQKQIQYFESIKPELARKSPQLVIVVGVMMENRMLMGPESVEEFRCWLFEINGMLMACNVLIGR